MPQRPGYGDHAAPEYETVTDREVEPKTKAATVGAGAGAVVSEFINYLLDVAFWHGPDVAPGVPLPVSAFVLLAVTSGGAFLGGYLARHVNRA